MATNTGTYSLTLTRDQADYLLRPASIGQLAVAESKFTGWLPKRPLDATQMTQHLQAIQSAPSLEQPMRELGAWLRKHRKE